jgi:hypothetical protein
MDNPTWLLAVFVYFIVGFTAVTVDKTLGITGDKDFQALVFLFWPLMIVVGLIMGTAVVVDQASTALANKIRKHE